LSLRFCGLDTPLHIMSWFLFVSASLLYLNSHLASNFYKLPKFVKLDASETTQLASCFTVYKSANLTNCINENSLTYFYLNTQYQDVKDYISSATKRVIIFFFITYIANSTYIFWLAKRTTSKKSLIAYRHLTKNVPIIQ